MNREILIVDDDDIYLQSVKRALQDRDLVIREAASVPEAIALLDADRRIRVILLDLHFKDESGLDGTKLLEHIKDLKSLYRVIVLTGHEERLAAEEARDFEVFAYLAKAKERFRQSL